MALFFGGADAAEVRYRAAKRDAQLKTKPPEIKANRQRSGNHGWSVLRTKERKNDSHRP
jgi:hypothetical protein